VGLEELLNRQPVVKDSRIIRLKKVKNLRFFMLAVASLAKIRTGALN
jgi:hypothetical protein